MEGRRIQSRDSIFHHGIVNDQLITYMRNFIITAELKDLQTKVALGHITFQRMIELLNEKAEQWHQNKMDALNNVGIIKPDLPPAPCRVKIIKCSFECGWYKNHIGEEFDVDNAGGIKDYVLWEDYAGNTTVWHHIKKEDCEVVLLAKGSPETQNEDIEYVRSILPDHYTVQESEKRGSIHCKSEKGIRKSPYLNQSTGKMVTDAEDEEHWGYIVEAIKKHFGDRFQEIDHNTCFCHVDFTIYLKDNK
jgi:hypothetical protein